MNLTNRVALKSILLVLLAGSLLSCGNKEERKAAYIERGKAYLIEKHYDNARIEFDNVLKIDPEDAQAYLYRGETEEKRQNWAKAFADYSKASELDPELIEARIRLATFYLAQANALKVRNKASSAANVLALGHRQIKEIRARDPDNDEAAALEATLWLTEGDVDRAIAQLENVVARKPGLQLAAALLSSLYDRNGRADDAEVVLVTAVQSNPDPLFLQQRLAAHYEKLEQNDKAERVLRQIVRDNPEELSHRIALASFLARTQQPDKADQVLIEAIAVADELQHGLPGSAEGIAPKIVTVYSELARSRMAGGNLTGAAEAYADGLKKVPDDNGLMIGLAVVRERQRDYDAAIALYEKVLEKQPGNAFSTNNLAALLVDHRSDRASLARAARLSVKLEKTGQPAFLDTAAWVYYRQGDYGKAAEILKGVVEKAPQVPVFQYHLGMTYYQQGDKVAARVHLEKATDGNADYPGIEEARAILKTL